jgi:TolB-like protein/Tfp pilus assembly protein PilF
MSFFAELRRRNVFRVGIAYVLIAWVLLQGADFALDLVEAPNWVIQALVALAVLGLPAALIFAWVFEMTPEGLKREKDIERDTSITHRTGRKLDRVIIGVLVLAVALLLADRFWHAPQAVDRVENPVATRGGAEAEAHEGARTDAPARTRDQGRSIAVLPFVNMSADEAQEYFADGITEEIINALVRIPGLEVAARTSVFAFKGSARDVRQVGRELGVGHILEGSVRSDGRALRITAQLIQVEDGFHEWSETYDREPSNIFAIQEDIARAIADVLSAQFAADTPTAAATENFEAYNDYLRGRAILRQRRDNDVEAAIPLFESVTRRDPDFAPAWASLAIAGDVLDRHAEAERWAKRALALDPDNVDALNALASVRRDLGEWEAAEGLFLRALAIDPGSSELIEDYAEFLASVGRVEEQVRIASEGYAIDPLLSPLAGVYLQGLIAVGDLDRAREVLDASVARGGPQWMRIVGLVIPMEAGDDAEVVAMIESLDLPEANRREALEGWNDPTPTRLETLLARFETLSAGDLFKNLGDDGFLYQTILLYNGYAPALERELEDLRETGEVYSELWFTPIYRAVRGTPKFTEMIELARLPAYWDKSGWPAYCARDDREGIQCR